MVFYSTLWRNGLLGKMRLLETSSEHQEVLSELKAGIVQEANESGASTWSGGEYGGQRIDVWSGE